MASCPITTEVDVEAPEGPPLPRRPLWKKADWKVVQSELEGQLQPLYGFPRDTRDELDALAEAIHQAIENTIAKTVPSARPSPQASEVWSEECTKEVKETRQAFWMWKASWLVPDWIYYRVAHNKKKRAIR
jgi:hypothetical protein